MKASVERVRWGLAGAGALLLVVLAVFLGYGSLHKGLLWKKEMKRLGAALHSPHETDNFTYSNSLQGHTSYTLHAAKVIQHGDGTWTLKDVVVTLYSKTSPDVDKVIASDIEYNDKTREATAVGEVDMELQAAGALAKTKTQPSAETDVDRVIHVKTSGLVYVQKLAVAATDQLVEFKYAGIVVTSKGAEFDSGESYLHLLADVNLNGEMRGKPMTVHAEKADLDRQTNTVAMVQPVAESEGQTARAANALLYLRRDGSLMRADGGGGVSVDAGTRHMTAQSFTGTFGATSLPQSSKLMGGVVVSDMSAMKPLKAQANEVDSEFDVAGNPRTMLATGGARVEMVEKAVGVPDLTREMRGDKVLATFVPVSLPGARKGARPVARLSEVVSTGSAMVRGESYAAGTGAAKTDAGVKTEHMWADVLRAEFDATAAQGSQLQQAFGTGHTKLEQDAPLGEMQTSTGDSLEVQFAKTVEGGAKGRKVEIASAVQAGHVVIHAVPAKMAGSTKDEVASDGSADKAVYDGVTDKLTLVGGAKFSQGGTELSAASIAVNQKTQDADAEGVVMATMASADKGASAKPGDGREQAVTHVTGDRAHMTHATQVAMFWGTDAKPARLWQGASQVQAASMVFDQKRRTLAARPATAGGVVHAVFAGEKKAESAKSVADEKQAGQVVRVVSSAMDYDDVNREANFTGSVRMDGETGQARSQRGVVLLNPAPVTGTAKTAAGDIGGSVKKVVLTGDVWIQEPGRTGTGEQLVYTAADSSFILTGTPAKLPHMVDAEQGSITGTTLVFHEGKAKGDSSIVVAGQPGDSAGAKRDRVRTETEVKK